MTQHFFPHCPGVTARGWLYALLMFSHNMHLHDCDKSFSILKILLYCSCNSMHKLLFNTNSGNMKMWKSKFLLFLAARSNTEVVIHSRHPRQEDLNLMEKSPQQLDCTCT